MAIIAQISSNHTNVNGFIHHPHGSKAKYTISVTRSVKWKNVPSNGTGLEVTIIMVVDESIGMSMMSFLSPKGVPKVFVVTNDIMLHLQCLLTTADLESWDSMITEAGKILPCSFLSGFRPRYDILYFKHWMKKAFEPRAELKYEGYPSGSMVDFAYDSYRSPILAVSDLAVHTKDLLATSRCSLLVARDPEDRTDIVITVHGDAVPERLMILVTLFYPARVIETMIN
ncbi:hypothetical protein RND71_001988 [Anisodus tanguticus]|uniref:Uncharacterized protein n=1 Tax=Anisodus tanguticus TaxID=243964 RepID=A0AAE1VW85_9SOLA|nr:hypothetical protein RND71_001988 [Anisodus tanguticus]